MFQITCLVENKGLPGFRAEHGVSFHIQTPDGKVLFDSGDSGDVLLANAATMEIDLGQLDALAISHAHFDHTGGLEKLLAQTKPGIPLYAHSDLFRPRYSQGYFIGIPQERETLAERATLHLSDEPQQILPGLWTTGDITERAHFEGRSESHVVPVEGDGWERDPYRDDLSLVLETEAGLVVVLGCGHAGLLNILNTVQQHFDGPIIAIAGGTHLVSATPAMLEEAVDVLRTRYNTPRLYPNHCTGQPAVDALRAAFGEQVQDCPAGTVLTF